MNSALTKRASQHQAPLKLSSVHHWPLIKMKSLDYLYPIGNHIACSCLSVSIMCLEIYLSKAEPLGLTISQAPLVAPVSTGHTFLTDI